MYTFDIVNFRNSFPEFADTVRYPDAQITFWSSYCALQINWRRFGPTMGLSALQLRTAHQITLAQTNQQTGVIGGTPGGQSGPINSKTVGSVTAAYDTTQTVRENTEWNLTVYGKQFYELLQMFGAGPVQII